MRKEIVEIVECLSPQDAKEALLEVVRMHLDEHPLTDLDFEDIILNPKKGR